MKTIIIANSNPQSYTHALADAYKKYLESVGEKYALIDLYSDGDFKVIGGLTKEKVMELQKQITDSSELVFIHPLYWINMPAILKNFMEQVFTEGFAYEYRGPTRDFVGLLTGKSARVIITGNGFREEYQDFDGKTDFEIVWEDLLTVTGFNNIKIDYIGGMDRLSRDQTAEILDNIEKNGRM